MTCSDSLDCHSCDPGYGLSNGLCIPCGPPNSNYLDGLNCHSNIHKVFFLILQDCPAGCATCSDSSTCQSCDPGYGLSNGLCIPCGNPNPNFLNGNDCESKREFILRF